ncbi:MAG TPA: sulfocyanin-like copper-binding protein [Thermoplasmata archaeon]|nr:sulfocyanin-like copper-binding protein [Thermoplasmata archaeon]
MFGGSSVALVVTILVVSGVGMISSPSVVSVPPVIVPATYPLNVSAVADYGYLPETFQQVPLSTTVVVTFTDKDPANLAHSFNISDREGFEIPSSYTTAQLNHLFGVYGTMYAAYDTSLGDVSVGRFQSPSTPGWYEFVCNVPGQFQQGMYGFIAFGENLPANLTPATYPLNVSAVADYGYLPETFQQVPLNATIVVTFTDEDPVDMAHSFNISNVEGFEIPNDYTAAQLNHLFGVYGTMYAAYDDGLGDVSVGRFHSPPTPGWYEFVCNVSGHFQQGMYGFIAFGENLPGNLTLPSRVGLGGNHLSFNPGDAAVIGGLAVVVVLGYVVWSRLMRQARRPPEPSELPRSPLPEAPADDAGGKLQRG